MNAKDLMCDAIDKDPSCLVDYADENELNELHAAIYAIWREPVTSDKYQNAQDFIDRYIVNAMEAYYRANSEQAHRDVQEYYDQVAEAA